MSLAVAVTDTPWYVEIDMMWVDDNILHDLEKLHNVSSLGAEVKIRY